MCSQLATCLEPFPPPSDHNNDVSNELMFSHQQQHQCFLVGMSGARLTGTLVLCVTRNGQLPPPGVIRRYSYSSFTASTNHQVTT